MIKKTISMIAIFFIVGSCVLSASVEYKVHDIGTLQTHSSAPIAINNKGEILGWYNIDGSKSGIHFFLKESSGAFHEIPSYDSGMTINWKYLTSTGVAYGTFDGNSNYSVLFMYDMSNGLVNLGNLPGKEVVAVNDSGQVLIKFVKETRDGAIVCYPVIWENGKVTKLKGLEGELGIESKESYGFDMNNKGDVVGKSVASLIYKNNICYQTHATMWSKGKVVDLHNMLPRTTSSYTLAVNDHGDFLIQCNLGRFFVSKDGELTINACGDKLNNAGYTYTDSEVYLKGKGFVTTTGNINSKILAHQWDSPWNRAIKIVSVNDHGEIILEGETVYGEKHAMLATPVSSNTK